jgi:hypothetical protein
MALLPSALAVERSWEATPSDGQTGRFLGAMRSFNWRRGSSRKHRAMTSHILAVAPQFATERREP